MWSRSALSLLLCVPALVADAGETKLDVPLRALYHAWKANGSGGLRAEAARRGIALRSGRVAVRLVAVDPSSARVLRRAATRGGGRFVAAEGASIFAEVPVARLPKLACEGSVLAVYADRPEDMPQFEKE